MITYFNLFLRYNDSITTERRFNVIEKMRNFFTKKKLKLTAGMSFLQLALFTGNSVVFADGDPTATINKSTETFTSKASSWGLLVAVLMLVIGGIALMISDELRRWAKKHIMWVIFGVAIIVISATIVSWVVTTFGG